MPVLERQITGQRSARLKYNHSPPIVPCAFFPSFLQYTSLRDSLCRYDSQSSSYSRSSVYPLPKWADFETGMDAYQRGNYATALGEWRPLADEAVFNRECGIQTPQGGLATLGSLMRRTALGEEGATKNSQKNRLDLGAESGRISPSQARRDLLRNQIIQRAALTDAERFIGSAARRRGNAGIQG